MPAGTIVSAGSLVSPGGQQGIAGQGGPSVVSSDSGNVATLGSDAKIYVPDPTPVIWSQRLRSVNVLSNPTMDVDQISGSVVGAQTSGKSIDRWYVFKSSTGTMAISAGRLDAAGYGVPIPGTNFIISRGMHRIQLTTAQATLGATDQIVMYQPVDGPKFRALSSDAHSMQILCRSSVANLKFAASFRDSPTTKSLVKLCTLPATPQVWTLIQLPNLPVFPTGNFTANIGALGYQPSITLACGSTYIAPATDTWQNGNFIGAPGMDNFAAQAVNSTFDIAYIDNTPGSICQLPIECQFNENLDDCLIYWCKSYPINVVPGTSCFPVAATFYASATTNANGPVVWPKRMVKAPTTVTIYNPQSGAANSVYRATDGTAVAVTAAQYVSEVGFLQITGTFTASTQYFGQWIADTGF